MTQIPISCDNRLTTNMNRQLTAKQTMTVNLDIPRVHDTGPLSVFPDISSPISIIASY